VVAKENTVRFAKIVFRVAGIYGLLVLTPMYFLESKIGRDTPPAMTHPEFFYGFVGVALAWQFVFLVLSTDPVRYRPMILPSILEKISFGIPSFILFSEGRISSSTLAVASVDWLLAFLFLAAYLKTAPARAAA
jgi:hypothetical protein